MTFWQQIVAYFSAAVGWIGAWASNIAISLDTLLSASIGTFVGAYAAFALERRDRKKEQGRIRATEGNLALLTLFQMFNVLRQFQKEVIDTAPDPSARWMTMKVTFPQTQEALTFDPARLAFLFECENHNLLPEMLLESRRNRLAMDMINRRAHLMLDKVYPLLSQKGVGRGESVPEAVIAAMLGPALAAEAQQLTEGIVQNVNEDVMSLRACFDELRRQLVKLLHGEKFIQVEFDMPADSKPSEQAKA